MLMQAQCASESRHAHDAAPAAAASTFRDQDESISRGQTPKSPASRAESADQTNAPEASGQEASKSPPPTKIEIRLLVRRREAGALIGKRGSNIKRMRETYKEATFNIPDTGNGPERVVCICTKSEAALEAILLEIAQLFLEKHPASRGGAPAAASDQPRTGPEDQVELKQLLNSAYAGLLIGLGGQSIRKLRSDTRAAIKIYEMCCPNSEERVCAIKARPPVVVATIQLIHKLMLKSQATIKVPLVAHKSYDALNFDLSLIDRYGGYIPDDCGPLEMMQLASHAARHCQPVAAAPHLAHPFVPQPDTTMAAEPDQHRVPYLHSRNFYRPPNLPPSDSFQTMNQLLCNPFRFPYQQPRELLQRFPDLKSPVEVHDEQQHARRATGMQPPVRSHRFQPYISDANLRDANFRARQIRHLQDQQRMIQQQLLSCISSGSSSNGGHPFEQQPLGPGCCGVASQMVTFVPSSLPDVSRQAGDLCAHTRLDPCLCKRQPSASDCPPACRNCPSSRGGTLQLVATASNSHLDTPLELTSGRERPNEMDLLRIDSRGPAAS